MTLHLIDHHNPPEFKLLGKIQKNSKMTKLDHWATVHFFFSSWHCVWFTSELMLGMQQLFVLKTYVCCDYWWWLLKSAPFEALSKSWTDFSWQRLTTFLTIFKIPVIPFARAPFTTTLSPSCQWFINSLGQTTLPTNNLLSNVNPPLLDNCLATSLPHNHNLIIILIFRGMFYRMLQAIITEIKLNILGDM